MSVRPLVLLLFLVATAGAARADLEDFLGAGEREFLLAVDHTSPEHIGPVVTHHHHHSQKGQEDRFELEVIAGADSRYVSEGRDNLPGEGGIVWGAAIGHVHALGGSVFGEIIGIAAWEGDYEELDLTAGYEIELGSVTLGGGVTYLWFPEDDEDDVELSLTAEWSCECGLGIGAGWVWSTEAEGWSGELLAFYEIGITERFDLVPAVFLGGNQGYVTDEHDGFDHVGVELEGIFRITDHVHAGAYLAYLNPIDDEDGESLRDLFWVGGAMTFTF